MTDPSAAPAAGRHQDGQANDGDTDDGHTNGGQANDGHTNDGHHPAGPDPVRPSDALSYNRSEPAVPPPGDRRPHRVYGVGTEPDPRFSMANERTALAWVRTGLALIAGGIALTSVAAVAELPVFLDLVAVFSCLFGAVTAVVALIQWQRNERAMRLGEPLPAPVALRWLVLVVLLAALIVAGYAISQT